MYGCGYKNGGCHKAAVCHRDDNGDISCKCGAGYRGDGYNCTGPCEINNGGCHRNADCFYKVDFNFNAKIPFTSVKRKLGVEQPYMFKIR